VNSYEEYKLQEFYVAISEVFDEWAENAEYYWYGVRIGEA
jgi:hypothetical protein